MSNLIVIIKDGKPIIYTDQKEIVCTRVFNLDRKNPRDIPDIEKYILNKYLLEPGMQCIWK